MTGHPEPLTAFVNERPVRVVPGSVVADAVRAADPALAEALAAGQAHCTDGRGIRLDPSETATAGTIVRVVRSARQSREPDADA